MVKPHRSQLEATVGQQLSSLRSGTGWSTHRRQAIRTFTNIRLVEGNINCGRSGVVEGGQEPEAEKLCWLSVAVESELPAGEVEVSGPPLGVVVRAGPSSLR